MQEAAYFYRSSMIETPEGAATHGRICALLEQLQASTRFERCIVGDIETVYGDHEEQQKLLSELREFAVRHKVGLGRVFGSRRHGFAYIPSQFLVIRDSGTLREVFPCRVGGSEIEPLEYLEQLAAGKAWTTRSGAGMEGTRHKVLVDVIVANPDRLEPGLVLRGSNVLVSQDFGEQGFIDLFFEDRSGRPMLVEVKCDTDELDKAVGQILRHRYFFAQQNGIPRGDVRVAVWCPRIPGYFRLLCHECGIETLELKPQT